MEILQQQLLQEQALLLVMVARSCAADAPPSTPSICAVCAPPPPSPLHAPLWQQYRERLPWFWEPPEAVACLSFMLAFYPSQSQLHARHHSVGWISKDSQDVAEKQFCQLPLCLPTRAHDIQEKAGRVSRAGGFSQGRTAARPLTAARFIEQSRVWSYSTRTSHSGGQRAHPLVKAQFKTRRL